MLDQYPPLKHERTDENKVLSPDEKFICSLCKFQFSTEKLLTNHFNFSNDVDNPADPLGADITTIKCEPCEEEITELLNECSTTEQSLAVKIEEMEFTETTVSGSTCTVSGQSLDPPEAETPEEVLPYSNYGEATAQSTHFQLAKFCKAEKHYKCNISDYTTAQHQFLKAHDEQRHTRKLSLNVHTKRRTTFKCASCDYTSTVVGSLKHHLRTHSGEKPFKCTVCDYAGARRSFLKEHIRMHTRETPFKCILCSHASARKSDLIKHMRTHTLEKPFKCSLCDYSATQNCSLTRHMKRHTAENKFKCTICDFSSAKNGSLKVHMTMHNGKKLL